MYKKLYAFKINIDNSNDTAKNKNNNHILREITQKIPLYLKKKNLGKKILNSLKIFLMV